MFKSIKRDPLAVERKEELARLDLEQIIKQIGEKEEQDRLLLEWRKEDIVQPTAERAKVEEEKAQRKAYRAERKRLDAEELNRIHH